MVFRRCRYFMTRLLMHDKNSSRSLFRWSGFNGRGRSFTIYRNKVLLLTMPIIALLCPHCAGKIELDDTREFGFCQYCGTKIMIEHQKQQAGDYQTTKSARLKEQVRKLLSEGNYQAAKSVLNELKQIDSKDPEYLLLDIECLYRKMQKTKQLIPTLSGSDSYVHIVMDYTAYTDFSSDKSALSEIIQSFELPPYDLQGNMNFNGRIRALGAGRLYMGMFKEDITFYQNDVAFLKENYLKTEKDNLKKPQLVINIFELMALDILSPSSRVFEHYAEYVPVVAALMDFIKIEKITGYGSEKIHFKIGSCPFLDKNKGELTVNPETISQYYDSIEKPSFIKGRFKKVPDEERNREYMQKYDKRVEGLKQFYVYQVNRAYKEEYTGVLNVIQDMKWITKICAPFDEKPPILSFEDTLKMKEEHKQYLDSLERRTIE